MTESAEDLRNRIFQQRRRINTRINDAIQKPDPRWPLGDDDRLELEAINLLLVDVERSLSPTKD